MLCFVIGRYESSFFFSNTVLVVFLFIDIAWLKRYAIYFAIASIVIIRLLTINVHVGVKAFIYKLAIFWLRYIIEFLITYDNSFFEKLLWNAFLIIKNFDLILILIWLYN